LGGTGTWGGTRGATVRWGVHGEEKLVEEQGSNQNKGRNKGSNWKMQRNMRSN